MSNENEAVSALLDGAQKLPEAVKVEPKVAVTIRRGRAVVKSGTWTFKYLRETVLIIVHHDDAKQVMASVAELKAGKKVKFKHLDQNYTITPLAEHIKNYGDE